MEGLKRILRILCQKGGLEYNVVGMKKDFDSWNKIKQVIEKVPSMLYNVREVWWCRMGVNIGSEQDGKGEHYIRPVVIIRSLWADSCVVVPLTTSTKEHFFRVPVGHIKENAKPSCANISQLRIVDVKRLQQKVGFLNDKNFTALKKRIRDLF